MGLHSHVLLLNRSYMACNTIPAHRALTLLYEGVVRSVWDGEEFDFDQWAKKTVDIHNDDFIGTPRGEILIPVVVRTKNYNKIFGGDVKFNRRNVMVRDRFTCQYCGGSFGPKDLNLDHVFPRAKGGKTHWENVVTSCIACNSAKADKLPHEVGYSLKHAPKKPLWINHIILSVGKIHEQWKPYLFLE